MVHDGSLPLDIPGNEYHETIRKTNFNRVVAYWISVTHPCASRPWKQQDLKFWKLRILLCEGIPWSSNGASTNKPMQWSFCWRHLVGTQGSYQETMHVTAGSLWIGSRRKKENIYSLVSISWWEVCLWWRVDSNAWHKIRQTECIFVGKMCVSSDIWKMCMVVKQSQSGLFVSVFSSVGLLSFFASLIPPIIWIWEK